MTNCSATSNNTVGSAAVPVPVVTAATTASTRSFASQTRAAGSPPCSRFSTARARVSPALALHTSGPFRAREPQLITAAFERCTCLSRNLIEVHGRQPIELDNDLVLGGSDRLDAGFRATQLQARQVDQVLRRLGQGAEAVFD